MTRSKPLWSGQTATREKLSEVAVIGELVAGVARPSCVARNPIAARTVASLSPRSYGARDDRAVEVFFSPTTAGRSSPSTFLYRKRRNYHRPSCEMFRSGNR